MRYRNLCEYPTCDRYMAADFERPYVCPDHIGYNFETRPKKRGEDMQDIRNRCEIGTCTEYFMTDYKFTYICPRHQAAQVGAKPVEEEKHPAYGTGIRISVLCPFGDKEANECAVGDAHDLLTFLRANDFTFTIEVIT